MLLQRAGVTRSCSPAATAAPVVVTAQQLWPRGLAAPATQCSNSNSMSVPLHEVWSRSSQRSTRCCCSSSARDAVVGGSTAAAAAAAGEQPAQQQDGQQALTTAAQEWSVLNFYHLVHIADPEEMLSRHKAFIAANGLDSICGRIYISNQGINCQGGGLKAHTQQYVAWVAAQPEFTGLFHTLWPADGPMFPKLRLKLKPNLISLAGGMSALPCTDPAMRATPLQPAEWREKMAQAAAVNAAVAAGRADPKKRVVVMDLRNDYEWDAGHFDWAPRPDEEVFAETPVPAAAAADAADAAAATAAAVAAAAAAVEQQQDESSDDDDEDDGVPGGDADDVPSPLRGADPDNTEVLMYCTGGIRCDVYSAALRQKGFNNLFTLHGGIQHYLREEGNEHWQGSLFVFDGRMAINPALQQQQGENVPLPAAVPCQLCGAEATLPHINCANMDCNELFIACSACKTRFHGCCCESCQSAPRLLRPIKVDGGNYGSWGNYADVDRLGPLISTKRSREGRVARRARRREAMKAKREALLEERRQMRAAMKAAMKAAAGEAGDAGEEGQQVQPAGKVAVQA